MRTSVCCDGATRSTGRYWMKSLKTAADFQISSSSLPSITGALSKRTSRVGCTFSGVSSAARRAAEVPGAAAFPPPAGVVVAAAFASGVVALPSEAAFEGFAGGGVGEGEAAPSLPPAAACCPVCTAKSISSRLKLARTRGATVCVSVKAMSASSPRCPASTRVKPRAARPFDAMTAASASGM